MRESTKGENAVKHPAYHYLLLDLDDTLLDWHKTEREALVKVIREMYSRELTEEDVLCYNRINARCWKRLELREITKDELKAIRFSEF
jgi:2-haloacid dehalogenase